MVITNRSLAAGTRLVANYKKVQYVCTVRQDEHGNVLYVTENPPNQFKSLSAAGSAVMDGIACNGWRFWSVDGAESVESAPVAANKPAAVRKPANQRRALKVINRTPNQQGVPEGSTRWFCSACMNGFIAEGTSVEVCPEGHRMDDPELTSQPIYQAEKGAGD